MSTDVVERSTPTQVLIPEARQHQKQRRVRVGVVAAISMLLVAGLITAAVLLASGPSASEKSRDTTAPVAAVGARGLVYFRPVLCLAPPYDPVQHASAGSGSLACSPASILSTTNLNDQPLNGHRSGGTPNGFSTNSVVPDTALAGEPSTNTGEERANTTVLLPAPPGEPNGGDRYVLGPAEMTSTSVASAKATRNQPGQWVVDYTTTTAGSLLWDKVAEENFHRYLAIDFGGVVVSAPIIEPTQSSFSSFKGQGQIAGSLTKTEAVNLAHALARRGRA